MDFLRSIAFGLLRINWCRAIHALAASLVLLLVSLPVLSQANQGTIQGSVFDQSGGSIPGAAVTVIDVARGVSKPLTTSAAGLYVAPNLIPGMYTVRAEAGGFQPLERTNVQVEVGQTVRVDLVLQAGAQAEAVTVTAEAPAIDTSDATLGGTIDQFQIITLPMNGRDFKNLIELRPGVTALPGGGIDTWSANGSRGEDVGYLVDGLRADEAYTGNSVVNSPMPSGDAATGLPVDAIQEINNQANPKAEVGWKPGAVINVGVKSGTNTLHGSAFIFGRTTDFDARNFFDTLPTPKQSVSLKQFGGSAGAPIIKDKLFWFADYEGQRYTVDSITSATSPVTVGLGGSTASSLVDACLHLNQLGAKISPLSAQLAGLNTATCAVAPTNYKPGASESLFPTNTVAGPVYFNLGNVASQNNAIGKLDYHVNDKHTISGTYFFGTGGITTPPAFGQPGIPTDSNPFASHYGATAQLLTGSWNWAVSSTRINEFRLGYDHFNQDYHSIDQNVNPLAYGMNTGATDSRTFGFASIGITGFNTFGGAQHKVVGPDGSLQLLDHFSLVQGNHTLKFGGEFIDNRATSYQNNGGKGVIRFRTIRGLPYSALENFLLGNVNSSGNSILVGDPTRHLSNQQYALFAQDDWRVSRKVNLNFGLRWEYNSVLKEANNLIGNFSPDLGLVQAGKQISSPLNGDFKDFSPRLGVAWDIYGTGRTVLRAGGSLMYSYLPIISYAALAQTLGLTLVPTGATIVTQGACANGCQGSGNIGVVRAAVPGATLTTNWQAQNAACVSGGNTACGTIFPTNTLKVQCGDGIGSDPSPCILLGMDPNYRAARIETWTFGLQQALTGSLFLDVSYVGTHGSRLEALTDINAAAPGSGFTAAQIAAGDPSVANITTENASRPFHSKFPYLADINWQANLARSNYSSLQLSLNQRLAHGFSYLLGYTYGHSLDNASTNSFSTVPADGVNPRLMYASSDYDIRHRFTFTTSYALPGLNSWGQMLRGWQFHSIVHLFSGTPWNGKDASNDFSGTGQVNNTDYFGGNWNLIGKPSDFSSGPVPVSCWSGSGGAQLTGCDITGAAPPAACLTAASARGPNTLAALNSIGCYFKGNSVLIPPALGTFGNAGRNIFRSSPFKNWDLSITKDWKLKERIGTQFRAEIFNILNHPNFANPGGIGSGAGYNAIANGGPNNGQFGCGCVTPDQASPNPVLGSGSARAMQLGLKVTF